MNITIRNYILGATLASTLVGCGGSNSDATAPSEKLKTYTGKAAIVRSHGDDVPYYTVVFKDGACATDYMWSGGENAAKALFSEKYGVDVNLTYKGMTRNGCMQVESLEIVPATAENTQQSTQRWR